MFDNNDKLTLILIGLEKILIFNSKKSISTEFACPRNTVIVLSKYSYSSDFLPIITSDSQVFIFRILISIYNKDSQECIKLQIIYQLLIENLIKAPCS